MKALAEEHRERDTKVPRPPSRSGAVVHAFGADLELPSSWAEKYTADDKLAVEKVLRWLADGASHIPGYAAQRTRAKLARAAGLNSSTVSLIMTGTYPSPPAKHLKRLLEIIDRDQRRHREIVRLPYVETSVSRLVYSICHRTHLYGDIGLIAGRPGTGKTEALKRYASEVDSAILIEASYNMSAGLLLDELIERTKATVRTARNGTRGTQAQRLRGVIDALIGTDHLVIVDEADTLTPANLEHLRRISDLGGVGIVLAGEPRLHGMVRDPDGRFGRIHSRIGFWPPVIRCITEEDCAALVEAAHATDKVTLTPELQDAYWQVCEGSARTLSKLLPNVRDFGMGQGHELTAKLIFTVAQQTMGIQAQRGDRS